jgi:4-amino-4-deoxy-L-arabinose transferase-like glycosyltransferase
MGRPVALLALFCLLAWLPGFFTLPPSDRDESRFAQATRPIVETGDHVRIMNGTEERNRKPTGINWQAPFLLAADAAGLAGATLAPPHPLDARMRRRREPRRAWRRRAGSRAGPPTETSAP